MFLSKMPNMTGSTLVINEKFNSFCLICKLKKTKFAGFRDYLRHSNHPPPHPLSFSSYCTFVLILLIP
jgi:hypothetical protein